MMGTTCRFMFTMPKKFTSNRDLASSVEVNSTAPEIPKPGVVHQNVDAPLRAMICSTAARTDSSSRHVGGDVVQALHALCTAGQLVHGAACILQRQRRGRPMPEVPPVTTATLLLICHYLPDDVHSLVQQGLPCGWPCSWCAAGPRPPAWPAAAWGSRTRRGRRCPPPPAASGTSRRCRWG